MRCRTGLTRSGAPRFPRARRSDPSSSHQAAAVIEISGAAASQTARILQTLERLPGSTSAELAKATGMDYHAVARRLPELAAAGKIRRTPPSADAVPCAVSGRRVSRWWPP